MKTTTAMTPMTEATTATGPSLWSRLCPLSCPDAAPDASVCGVWAAKVTCIAPWAGVLGTAMSQISDARRAVTVAMTARRRNRPVWRCPSVQRIVVLDGPGCLPVLLQQRIAVDVMLRAADPLPAAQKRLLSESAILCCSL